MHRQVFAFLFCLIVLCLTGIGCGPPELVAHPLPDDDALEDYHRAVVAIEGEPELEN